MASNEMMCKMMKKMQQTNQLKKPKYFPMPVLQMPIQRAAQNEWDNCMSPEDTVVISEFHNFSLNFMILICLFFSNQELRALCSPLSESTSFPDVAWLS